LRRPALTLVLVWFTAFNLRTVIFGVPPVLPAVRADLGLNFSETGSITSLILLTLAGGSIPGALLVGRFPARRLVSISSLALGLFAIARVFPPSVPWLFGGTVLLALGVALAQPSMAVLIRRWFPDGITRASNLYSNGLLLGNVGGASLTPLLAQLVGWRGSFIAWGACALAGAALWDRLTPAQSTPARSARVWSALRDPRAWQMTALFVFQNLAYFTVATWLPFLLKGRGALYVSVVFLCLNCFPVVPLLALPLLRWNYPLSTLFYVGAGLVTTVGALGLLLGLGDLAWLLAFMVGLGTGAAFVAMMTLPPLLAASEGEAAGLSAVIFSVGYLFSFVGPVVAGMLADRNGDIGVAFWPAVIAAMLMAVFGALAPRMLLRSRAPAEATAAPTG
jgi:MFS transporter, CP family, cyanate transporter